MAPVDQKVYTCNKYDKDHNSGNNRESSNTCGGDLFPVVAGGHIRFPSVLNTDANLGLDLITDQLEPM